MMSGTNSPVGAYAPEQSAEDKKYGKKNNIKGIV